MSSKTLLWIIVAIVVLALIILPTFTPEDIYTTVPLFGVLGWRKFAVVSGVTLLILGIALLIAYNNPAIKDFLKRKHIIS